MIDFIIVLIYLAITLAVGLYNAKTVSSDKEYTSAGQQYSALIVFCTLTATYLGGGFTIGLAEKTFLFGIMYVIAMYGFSLKEILIAKYVAPKMEYFQDRCITAGEIMKTAYGSSGQLLTGFASLIVCSGIIGAQFATCGNIFEHFLNIPSKYGILITSIIIITYVTLGGIKSVVKVNIFHFITLSIVLVLLCVLGLHKVGGINNLIKLTPVSYFSITGGTSFLTLLILTISFFLGETLVPPYIQRLLIGKTSKDTSKGTFYSGIASTLIFTIVGVTGIIVYAVNPDVQPNLAFPNAVSIILPIGLQGLGIAAIFAIIMSSADAFLHSTSIAVRRDILCLLGWKINPNSRVELNFSRIITCILGIVATIFAIITPSVLDILLYSYQFWTPFILVPLFAAIYRIKTSSLVFIISSIAATTSVIAWNLMSNYISPVKGSLEGVILGTIVNLVTFSFLRMTKLNNIVIFNLQQYQVKR